MSIKSYKESYHLLRTGLRGINRPSITARGFSLSLLPQHLFLGIGYIHNRNWSQCYRFHRWEIRRIAKEEVKMMMLCKDPDRECFMVSLM